jgi:proteic killer suppression protein
MIKSFRHKSLRNYWDKGQTKGLHTNWLPRLKIILDALASAKEPEDMNFPGSYFHSLSGKDKDLYSVRVTANYRITFGWSDEHAIDIDLEDYH